MQLKSAYEALTAHATACTKFTALEADNAAVEKLIELAARFVVSATEAGGREILGKQANWLGNATNESSRYSWQQWETRFELLKLGIKRAKNWGSLVTEDSFHGHDFDGFFQFPHLANQLLNEAQELAATILDPSGASLAKILRWRDALWEIIQMDRKHYYWGYYLLAQCSIAYLGMEPFRKEYLCFVFSRSFPAVVTAIQNSAADLYEKLTRPVALVQAVVAALRSAAATQEPSPSSSDQKIEKSSVQSVAAPQPADDKPECKHAADRKRETPSAQSAASADPQPADDRAECKHPIDLKFETPSAQSAASADPQPARATPRYAYASDFSSIVFHGTPYTFTGDTSPRIVEALWEAWEKGLPGVSGAELLKAAKSKRAIADLIDCDPELKAVIRCIRRDDGTRISSRYRFKEENE